MDAAAVTGDSRLRILAEVSHSLASVTTDYKSVLDTIAKTCARLIGDGCLVTLIDANEHLVGAANAHRDLDLQTAYQQYVGGVDSVPVGGASISAQVVRSGTPVFVPHIDSAALVARTEKTLQPLLERLNIHSFIVVPIRAHNATIGTLSMMRCGVGPDYVEEDVVLLTDLADRAGLAIDNARLYEELEARVRQRTSELEVFSFAVAHSIRAPLRTIATFSDILYEDAGDQLDERSRDGLQRIRTAIGRVRETVDGLTHLARLTGSELRRTTVNASDVAMDVVKNLQEVNPGLHVEVQIAPALHVHADLRLVTLVLQSLLSNSWQNARDVANARISFAADAAGSSLEIRDNGNLHLDQAVALLDRTSSSKPGTIGDFGLGLVIARQAVEQGGGQLEVLAPIDGELVVRFHFGRNRM